MSPTRQPQLCASEVAILRDGPRVAVLAALAALRADGLVEASYGGRVRSRGWVEPGRDPVELAIHATALEAPVRVAAFVTRLMVAIELDEMRASAERKVSRHAWARRRTLDRLRREHGRVAPGCGARDAAMAVALFGEAALMKLDPAFAVTVLRGPPQEPSRRWYFRVGERPADRIPLRPDGTEPGTGLSYSPPGGRCGG